MINFSSSERTAILNSLVSNVMAESKSASNVSRETLIATVTKAVIMSDTLVSSPDPELKEPSRTNSMTLMILTTFIKFVFFNDRAVS